MKSRNDKIARKEKILYLPLDKITPNLRQPRRHFDQGELNGLAESIRENGVLQPITVCSRGDEYFLIAGERRLRACHIAGLSDIPCIIIEADDKQITTLALLENLQRADLNFFEEAAGINRLMRICGYTQEETAKKLGKSQSAISNKLRLLSLGNDIILRICDAGLSERHARALLRLTSRESRIAALDFIINNNFNVAQTDSYIDSLLKGDSEKSGSSAKGREQYIIKDVRLFYNTIDKAMETMRRAGWRADISREEDDSCINMSIKIYK